MEKKKYAPLQPWLFIGKHISVRMNNGDVYSGNMKCFFTNIWVFNYMDDNGNPAQAFVNPKLISSINYYGELI